MSGKFNTLYRIVKISRSKSLVKFPLAWQRGFAMVGCEMQKTQLLVSFLGLDMEGGDLRLVRARKSLR